MCESVALERRFSDSSINGASNLNAIVEDFRTIGAMSLRMIRFISANMGPGSFHDA